MIISLLYGRASKYISTSIKTMISWNNISLRQRIKFQAIRLSARLNWFTYQSSKVPTKDEFWYIAAATNKKDEKKFYQSFVNRMIFHPIYPRRHVYVLNFFSCYNLMLLVVLSPDVLHFLTLSFPIPTQITLYSRYSSFWRATLILLVYYNVLSDSHLHNGQA